MSEGIGSVTNESTPGEVSTPLGVLHQRLRDEIQRSGASWWRAGARALLAVLDIHQPRVWRDPLERGEYLVCGPCGQTPPCSTVQAIAEQLGVER